MTNTTKPQPKTTRASSTPGIEVRPVTTAIGAEIHGIDLSRPVDDAAFKVIHDALMEHEVVFFRDQDMTPEGHLELAKRFGTPDISKKLKRYEGYEVMSLLENDGSKKAVGGMWHADNTDYANPPMGSLLYAEVAPRTGGDTMFSSMTAAFDALSSGLKRYLMDLTALHDNSTVRRTYAAEGSLRDEGTVVDAAVEHPVVRMHPVTKKPVLFVNSTYTQRIVGVDDNESKHILSLLFEHVMKPEFQVRFRWQAGSMAIWDNRATQHYALDDYNELRRMRRVQIIGDTPVRVEK
ncbi:TauD/TfdA family dioxygenase [Roseovarius sp.]|uniref:TauD/TfdA dioxygenase family protein n=1 Tax=Roseovarius sp. TaxID=1486281 RepID=UPI00261A1CE9|nr:TauD/TfdA family dioxygenase [Roseovarius sp.]MDM8164943.1 TauD/TfdA family dioxygenase [Roseovarius sp.]